MDKISTQIESSIVNVSHTEDPIARKLPTVMFEIITILLQHLPDTSICEKVKKKNTRLKIISIFLLICLFFE